MSQSVIRGTDAPAALGRATPEPVVTAQSLEGKYDNRILPARGMSSGSKVASRVKRRAQEK